MHDLTPNHQKQCSCPICKNLEMTQGVIDKALPPQVEKVSEEKLKDVLPLVEKQVGGALRRLQVQELKDAEGEETIWPDRHSSKEEITCDAFCRNCEGYECTAPTPENDSWENWVVTLSDSTNPRDTGLLVVKLRLLISSLESQAYERGKKEEEHRWLYHPGNEHDNRIRKEERQKLREVVEELCRRNKEAPPSGKIEEVDERAYDAACVDVLTALSEGEGR